MHMNMSENVFEVNDKLYKIKMDEFETRENYVDRVYFIIDKITDDMNISQIEFIICESRVYMNEKNYNSIYKN